MPSNSALPMSTQCELFGAGRPVAKAPLNGFSAGSWNRGRAMELVRAGKVSVKKPWFSVVLRKARNFLASSGFFASFGIT